MNGQIDRELLSRDEDNVQIKYSERQTTPETFVKNGDKLYKVLRKRENY